MADASHSSRMEISQTLLLDILQNSPPATPDHVDNNSFHAAVAQSYEGDSQRPPNPSPIMAFEADSVLDQDCLTWLHDGFCFTPALRQDELRPYVSRQDSDFQPSAPTSETDVYPHGPPFEFRDDTVFSDSYASLSAAYTAPSDSSIDPVDSLASFASTYTQKRRRRQPRARRSVSKQRTGKRKYQCTFCTDTFKTKHD